ncbi:MAG: lytic transglycosylase domain-containing protein [Bacteroidota bacterium]
MKMLTYLFKHKWHWVLISVTLLILVVKVFVCSSNQPNDSDKNYKEAFKNNCKVFSVEIPNELSFAGEKVPLEYEDVRENLERELLINCYWQSNTILMIKRANRWFPLIESILKEQGVPDDFKYLAMAESGLTHATSTAGACGYWQFMKDTGIRYGLEINDEVDERYNIEKATVAACKYLKNAYAQCNYWTNAAASYNMGEAGMKKQIDFQGCTKYYDLFLNMETSRYIFRILSLKLILQKPSDYGFYLRNKDLYQAIPTYKVSVDSSVSNLADFAVKNKTTYKVLKQFNPWLRDRKLTNKTKKQYIFTFPENQYLLYLNLLSKIKDPNSLINDTATTIN